MGVNKSADEVVKIGMNAPQLQRSQKKNILPKDLKGFLLVLFLDYEYLSKTAFINFKDEPKRYV